MSDRPTLLYVSPVVPAATGNGLAMRAAHVFLAYARSYRVSLLVAARYGSPAGSTVPPEIAAVCRDIVVSSEPDAMQSTAAFGDAPFAVVHVFRLGTVPAARPFLEPESAPERRLDLDDVESSTLRRIAALHRLRGDETRAIAEEAAAAVVERAERETCSMFDRLYVCTAADVARLPESVRARVAVLPNVLPTPEPLPPVLDGDQVDLLFIGTLGYFPNADGITWFAQEVLPLIRTRTPRRVALRIVGTGFSPLVIRLRTLPDVELAGYAPDVRPWYARSRFVVVPIRAGGGTRLKILEAFALRRPVVATTIGAEGIAAEHGVHLLRADDPEEFAQCCLRLIGDPDLGAMLTANAFALFSARYTLEGLTSAVATAPAPPPR